ncbi:MAG: exopolysaccharide biosynthesis protein [Bradyrhizobium sp.]|uniref:exopolysaccharide biosynthesis protein n=1 Tax=Bradyrhizobium sp. TaxID=376 RepID=UPI003C47510B
MSVEDSAIKQDEVKQTPQSVSAMLLELVDSLPVDHFTLEWLLGRLDRRSFGIVLLILSLAALVPGVSMLAGPLLAVPAFEMILGRRVPSFPWRVAIHPLRTTPLASIVRRALPVVMFLEKIVHPRWHISPDVSRRAVGIAVLIVSVLFLVPLPLIQIVPALLVALMALAYLEEDGLLLCLSLVGAAVLLAITTAATWGTILGVASFGALSSPASQPSAFNV